MTENIVLRELQKLRREMESNHAAVLGQIKGEAVAIRKDIAVLHERNAELTIRGVGESHINKRRDQRLDEIEERLDVLETN